MVEGGGLENRFPVLRNGGSNPSPSANVAFLRGINVGGHKKVTMADLKKAFESMGFRNVRTVLASGNVIFEAPTKRPPLGLAISKGLEKAFGFPVAVILRTVEALRALVDEAPFKNVPSGPDVRLYVTFLAESAAGRSRPGLSSPPKAVCIVRATATEVCSVATLSPGVGTPDLMAFLEKALGREVTTRNWQTILKLVRSGT